MPVKALAAILLFLFQSDLTIRTTTRLVTVDVVVTDRDGKPVTDLKASDFTVLDERKPQEIRVFQSAGKTATHQSVAERLSLPAGLPSNIYSNIAQPAQLPDNVSVILLDALNTPLEDQSYAKQQILKFLQQLQPGDRVGIYALGRELVVLHDFSSDIQSLLAAVRESAGNLVSATETESTIAMLLNNNKLDQILNTGREREIAETQISMDQTVALSRLENRIQQTYAALEAIAQQMAPVPGRKNLLWVSGAFPGVVTTDIRTGTGSPQSFGAAALRAARAITSAGVSVYPIDARGVMTNPLYKAKNPYRDYAMAQVIGQSQSRGGRRGGRATFTSPDPMVWADRDETEAHHDAMLELARRTGGKAFLTTNDTAKAIRSAIDDSAGTYQLGYSPSGYEDDGKYRRIQVKVSREGLLVRHREGYYAADNRPARDQQQREAMWQIMAIPLQAGAVPMLVQCTPIDAEGKRKLRVALKLDPAAVSLRESGGHWVGRVDVVLLYLDSSGKSRGGSDETLSLQLTAAQRDQALRGGFNYQLIMPWVADAHRLVVGVRDAPTGRIGTVRVEIDKHLGLVP